MLLTFTTFTSFTLVMLVMLVLFSMSTTWTVESGTSAYFASGASDFGFFFLQQASDRLQEGLEQEGALQVGFLQLGILQLGALQHDGILQHFGSLQHFGILQHFGSLQHLGNLQHFTFGHLAVNFLQHARLPIVAKLANPSTKICVNPPSFGMIDRISATV